MLGEAIILAGSTGFIEIKPVKHDFLLTSFKINNKPFLEILFRQLLQNGVKYVVISIPSHLKEIQDFYGSNYNGQSLVWVTRDDETQSGLALVQARKFLKSNYSFVLFDHSYFEIPFRKFSEFHFMNESALTIALSPVKHLNNDLSVEIDGTRIVSFGKSGEFEEGLVNSGIYIMDTKIFDSVTHSENFSLVYDFLNVYCQKMNFNGFVYNGFYMNIVKQADLQKLGRSGVHE